MNKNSKDEKTNCTSPPKHDSKPKLIDIAYDFAHFIQSLDEDGIETFISVGKEVGSITDEIQFRQLLKDIKNQTN